MNKLKLIAGPCVIEDRDTAWKIAKTVREICKDLHIEFIFKASFKKANRTSIHSFTGIGDTEALGIIRQIGLTMEIQTTTDVHEGAEAVIASEYVDILQIPAFLCRQTDLLVAAAESGKIVNIKKGQFMSHDSIMHSAEKVIRNGAVGNCWVTERGNSFGYNDLIVDATAITRLKRHMDGIIMDCTHSTQKPNLGPLTAGGGSRLIEAMALTAVVQGADGLFIETHPNPSDAKSDSATMLPLDQLKPLLEKVVKVRKALF